MSKVQEKRERRLASRLGRQGRGFVGRRNLSGKIVLAVVAGAVVWGVAGVALGGGSVAGKWFWFDGNTSTYLGSPKGVNYPANSLLVQVAGDLDMGAGHFRFGSIDGNYEFEHGTGSPYTRLNSYYIGTPTRTPIVIGGNDGQDVLSLLVQGKAGQSNDLQEWESGPTVGTAINGSGNLRVGNVVLLTKIVNGRVQLIAQLPDGSTQVLATGTPGT